MDKVIIDKIVKRGIDIETIKIIPEWDIDRSEIAFFDDKDYVVDNDGCKYYYY